MFDDLNAYERAVLKDVLIATKRALREKIRESWTNRPYLIGLTKQQKNPEPVSSP